MQQLSTLIQTLNTNGIAFSSMVAAGSIPGIVTRCLCCRWMLFYCPILYNFWLWFPATITTHKVNRLYITIEDEIPSVHFNINTTINRQSIAVCICFPAFPILYSYLVIWKCIRGWNWFGFPLWIMSGTRCNGKDAQNWCWHLHN